MCGFLKPAGEARSLLLSCINTKVLVKKKKKKAAICYIKSSLSICFATEECCVVVELPVEGSKYGVCKKSKKTNES